MEWMIGIVVGITGAGLGYGVRVWLNSLKIGTAVQNVDRILTDAKRDADNTLKEARLQAKADVLKAREEFESSTKARREELTLLESRIGQREANLDRKVSLLDKKERAVDQKAQDIEKLGKDLDQKTSEIQRLRDEEREKLQRVAVMTQTEARQILLNRMESEVQNEMAGLIRKRQEDTRETAEREAQKIVTLAVQRYAASHAAERMTSSVALPNDEMKGRIIGRDGRNIRAIEAATGVNLLIDDTPEAVVISSFDPVRREIARLALERLIMDGRIHPGRIEEVIDKTRTELESAMRVAGDEAAYLVGAQGVDLELLRMLGRLKYRTSYSQNVLMHSLEVAQLMGVMASELQLDAMLAKRIGLVHDIGKALDHEVEGAHAIIGADVLKRHGEAPLVVNAVAAHHEEVPAESLYALLASAGDAISGSRPGARSETTDIYVKRIEKLETIANSFAGVEKSYAIQAGREVRVIVEPEKVDDHAAITLARNISRKIETELQYPGQIRVIVIRETRCVEYAR
jgi:ribonuclease Y